MQETISFTPQLGTSAITRILWLIPAVPILASGAIALLKQPKRKTASTLAIGSLGFSLLLALAAFGHVVAAWSHGVAVRETVNFTWFQFGVTNVDLGARRKLHALFLLSKSVCGSHAGRGDC
jgi:NADH-quinone oxidoreductase subunit L